MKNIDYFNKLINELVVHVEDLIMEAPPSSGSTTLNRKKNLSDAELRSASVTDEDKLAEIIRRQEKDGTPNQIDVREIYGDISDGKWPNDFPSEQELDKWFQENTGQNYTIKDGKHAGKVLTSGVYNSIRLTRGLQSLKSRSLKRKKSEQKGHASICGCIGLVRLFVDKNDFSNEESDCSSIRQCRNKFLPQWKAKFKDNKNLTKSEKKKHKDYLDECEELYGRTIYDIDKRKLYTHSDPSVPNTPYCQQWDEEIKISFQDLHNDLASKLGEFFRTKNKSALQKKAKQGDVAAEIIMFKKITIKYGNSPNFDSSSYSGNAQFPNCTRDSEDIAQNATITYEIMSASPHNGGNVVVLKSPGGKYIKMNFKTADRNVQQNGSLVYVVSDGDITAVCPGVNWVGEITRLEN